MHHRFRPAGIGLIVALFATASAASSTLAETRTPRHHKPARSHPVAGPAHTGDSGRADAARNGGQSRGLYAGAGGIYSPEYRLADPGTIHFGAQLLGGDFGKAYEDYYRHYYYYKYAYCPIGTGYVIYLRRCVGFGNLLQ